MAIKSDEVVGDAQQYDGEPSKSIMDSGSTQVGLGDLMALDEVDLALNAKMNLVNDVRFPVNPEANRLETYQHRQSIQLDLPHTTPNCSSSMDLGMSSNITHHGFSPLIIQNP